MGETNRFSKFDTRIVSNLPHRVKGRLAAPWLALTSPRGLPRDAHIYYLSNRISFSQIFPFIYYRHEIARRYGVALRFIPVEPLIAGKTRPRGGADIVLFQTWFTIEHGRLAQVAEQLAVAYPASPISFLDSFAHNDLRLARTLDPYIAHYLKKSLFKDKNLYLRDFRGDTNLTEYYGDLYGIAQDPTVWDVPESILPKLRLSPNFFTAAHFIKAFQQAGPPVQAGREIDVHSRLAIKGSPWYSAMRQTAQGRLAACDLPVTVTDGRVDHAAFMAELRASQICFSPFGYGELCWRDIEAFQTGAVLVKPDMAHLETLPDLYQPDETYLPVSWDFGDLDTVIAKARESTDQREYIARNAYARVRSYLEQKSFLDDIAFLMA